jgi:6-methylsalicylic acid synthase
VASVGAINTVSKVGQTMNLTSIRSRLQETLPPSFTIDYLAKVGVTAMGFLWEMVEHVRNENKFLAVVDADPQSIDTSAH